MTRLKQQNELNQNTQDFGLGYFLCVIKACHSLNSI
jgi:hypothetical protein